MRPLFGTLMMIATLAVLPLKADPGKLANAFADANAQAVQSEPPTTVEPPTPPPSTRPAPPPEPPPPPRPESRQEKPSDTGQWVYTEQYGWVWMPYGDRYTHLPPDGATPSMYVYYPEAGWCWVVAPWLWGWGPSPYFGVFGPRFYGWWGIGLGHWYGFSGRYAYWGGSGRAYWHGGRWNGVGRSYGTYGRGTGTWSGSGHSWGGGGHSRSLSPAWRR